MMLTLLVFYDDFDNTTIWKHIMLAQRYNTIEMIIIQDIDHSMMEIHLI